jgi:hypothetical protein
MSELRSVHAQKRKRRSGSTFHCVLWKIKPLRRFFCEPIPIRNVQPQLLTLAELLNESLLHLVDLVEQIGEHAEYL